MFCMPPHQFRIAPSLSSITLRLRQLDDVGIGEIALVLRRKECGVRRLDLSGNFGNSGVKIVAEALKTNTSLKTVTIGCHKSLNDVGAQELLDVVDPFTEPVESSSSEWDKVTASNHTLQSIYILDRPGTVTVSKDLIKKLQSISTLDAHRTLQSKCWHHIEKNIETISHLGLETKHMPEVLSFVHQHGSIDHLFRLVKSSNTPELFTNPSPEKARLSHQMKKIDQENEKLRELLGLEREKSESLNEQNNHLRSLTERGEDMKRYCCLPIHKLVELWRNLIEDLKDIFL